MGSGRHIPILRSFRYLLLLDPHYFPLGYLVLHLHSTIRVMQIPSNRKSKIAIIANTDAPCSTCELVKIACSTCEHPFYPITTGLVALVSL
jgi:hypothetical protein